MFDFFFLNSKIYFVVALYLVSLNYNGFAYLKVKLSAVVLKFMPCLLLCVFSPYRCIDGDFCTL